MKKKISTFLLNKTLNGVTNKIMNYNKKQYQIYLKHKDNIKYDKERMKTFLYWILQRQKIYVKKSILKLERPWTDDPILDQYSFTNVLRKRDKVSIYVVDNICQNNQLTLKQKIMNLIWFRITNKPETYQKMGLPIKQEHCKTFKTLYDYTKKQYDNILSNDPNYVFSRPAYMNSGCKTYYFHKYPDNMFDGIQIKETQLKIFYGIYKALTDGTIDSIIDAIQNKNAELVFEQLQQVSGISTFLAFQIYVDITYIPSSELTQNNFVYPGNGAIYGIKTLFDTAKIKSSQLFLFIYWLQQNLTELFNSYQKIDDYKQYIFTFVYQDKYYISLSNLQNCLCEFSKYYKHSQPQVSVKARIYKPGQ